MPWSSGHHYCTTSFHKVELRFYAGSTLDRHVSEIRDGDDLDNSPGWKAKHLSSVNHTTKTIHHHYHHHHQLIYFFNSQFNYCPAIWMFHSKALNNRLPKHCLCIIFNNKNSKFGELLEEDNSVSMTWRNIYVLATETYKVANDISPEIMNEVFPPRELFHYNLCYTSK